MVLEDDEVPDAVTLVLGGGGVPGLAYISGVLRALRDVTGFEADSADLVIGTSAGAMAGALLRAGCPLEDLASRAIGVMDSDSKSLVDAAWASPTEFFARVLGSYSVVARAGMRLPLPDFPRVMGRFFPGAMVVPRDSSNIDRFGDRWPVRPLWIVTVDLVTGRRMLLRRSLAKREIGLSEAVRASTAVPGLFAPFRFGRHLLVDGGCHSAFNLDLAARAENPVVICIAPLGTDRARDTPVLHQVLRAPLEMRLGLEFEQVRRTRKKVILFRPGRRELAHFPVNFLSPRRVEDLQQEAYAVTCEKLLASGPKAAVW